MFDLLPCWAESNPSAIERSEVAMGSINPLERIRTQSEMVDMGEGDVLELHDCV
jgi:hypothetical protein